MAQMKKPTQQIHRKMTGRRTADIGYRAFNKAMADAIVSITKREMRVEREQHGNVLGSFLFDGQIPQDRSNRLARADNHILKMGKRWLEIYDSILALEAVYMYLKRESSRPSSISAVQHLKYHFEHFLQEIYILHNRLQSFVTLIRRSYKKDHGFPRHVAVLDALDKLISRSTDQVVKTRGQHVHVVRFEDADFLRLSVLEQIATKDREFQPFLRAALHEVRKKKLEAISSNNRTVKKFFKIYCKALYPVLFDRKGNFQLPQGIMEA